MKISTKVLRLYVLFAFFAIIAIALVVSVGLSTVAHPDGSVIASQDEIAILSESNAGIKQIEAAIGGDSTFVLFNNGKLFATGENNYGQLGLGDKNPRTRFDRVPLENVTMVACGSSYTFAVAGGKLYASGNNNYGQLGLGDNVARANFEVVEGVTNVEMMSAGFFHSVILADGKVYSAGLNDVYQLGFNDKANRNSFDEVRDLSDKAIASIACGSNFSFAVTDQGVTYATGKNDCGQLGFDDQSDKQIFTEVPSLKNYKIERISCGKSHSIAMPKDKKSIYVAGLNSAGQLGTKDNNNRLSFTKVSFDLTYGTILDFDCSMYQSFVFVNSCLYSTGNNQYGQLGLGHNDDLNEFSPLQGHDGLFAMVAAGRCHTVMFCGLSDATSDGTLYVSGYNARGQLGFGNTTNINSFTQNSVCYNIEYDANGGVGEMEASSLIYYSSLQLPENSFTRDGYTFAGWATSVDGEKLYNDRERVVFLADIGSSVTLYAVWTLNSPTLTLQADSTAVTYGTPIVLTAAAVEYGDIEYTYIWYKNSEVLPDRNAKILTLNEVSESGSYKVKVTAKGNNQTKSSDSDPVTVTISRADIAPSVILDGWTYGQVSNTPGLTNNPGNGAVKYMYSASENGEYTETKPTDAGTYYVRATVSETANYNGHTTASASFIIAKASINLSVTLGDRTYGTPANIPVIGGNTGHGEITYLYKGTANDGEEYDSADAPVKAGGYTLTVSADETANYLGGDAKVSFAIERAAIPAPVIESKAYNGSNQTADIPGSAQYNVTANNGGTSSGIYGVGLTLTDADNYKWADGTAVSGEKNKTASLSFEITRAENKWKIAPQADGNIYGGELTLAGQATYGEVMITYETVNGEPPDETPFNAGRYKAIFTVIGTSDYEGITTATQFEIAPREIGIKIDDKTSIYDKAQETLTYTITSGEIMAGDDLHMYLTKANGNNVGKYAITGEWQNPNYNVTFTEGIYEIIKATYDMKDVAWDYSDAFTYDGEEKKVTVIGLPVGVTVKNYTDHMRTNAGTYTAKVTFDYDTANYNAPALADLAWTINKADIIATVTLNGWTYGATANDASVSGNIGSGDVTYEYSADGETYSATKPTNAGTYYVRATVAATDNYNGAMSETVTFTVAKAVYDMSGVKFENKTVDANGNAQTITVSGRLPDGVTVTYSGSGTEAGTYTITAKFSGDFANYEAIADMTATLTVNKAAEPAPAPDDPEPEKGGCGSVVMDGVTIAGIAVSVLAIAAALSVRKVKNKKK